MARPDTCTTETGTVTIPLRPPGPVTISVSAAHPAGSDVDEHVRREIHDQVWSYLLRPTRPLRPLANVVDALVAVGALDPASPVAARARAVDTAVAGGPVAAIVPRVYAHALTTGRRPESWMGVASLSVLVDHPDGPRWALEALVALRGGLRTRGPLLHAQHQGSDACSRIRPSSAHHPLVLHKRWPCAGFASAATLPTCASLAAGRLGAISFLTSRTGFGVSAPTGQAEARQVRVLQQAARARDFAQQRTQERCHWIDM